MLNKEKHQLIMGRILRDIYSDATIAPLLGFKGGTCAYIFYGLPRFSVDLDFDLFTQDKEIQKIIFEKIKSILAVYGQVKDYRVKRFTIFFLLSYGELDRNIKVEINLRMLMPNLKEQYELKKYLGISMLVGKKDYIFASKLVALTSRSEPAMRDIFDIWYFAKHNWEINDDVIKVRTEKNIKTYLVDCIHFIEKIKDTQILQGLGDLLNAKDKIWVKANLRQETIFLLKNYYSVLK